MNGTFCFHSRTFTSNIPSKRRLSHTQAHTPHIRRHTIFSYINTHSKSKRRKNNVTHSSKRKLLTLSGCRERTRKCETKISHPSRGKKWNNKTTYIHNIIIHFMYGKVYACALFHSASISFSSSYSFTLTQPLPMPHAYHTHIYRRFCASKFERRHTVASYYKF